MTRHNFLFLFWGRHLPGRISKLHEPNCTDFEDIEASSALNNYVSDVRYVPRLPNEGASKATAVEMEANFCLLTLYKS